MTDSSVPRHGFVEIYLDDLRRALTHRAIRWAEDLPTKARIAGYTSETLDPELWRGVVPVCIEDSADLVNAWLEGVSEAKRHLARQAQCPGNHGTGGDAAAVADDDPLRWWDR